MLKIAICDDDDNTCSRIEDILIEFFKEQGILFEIDIFNSGESIYKKLKNKCIFDIIFLDIEMKELNGIELGKEIRDFFQNETTKIIYISSYEEYCMDLFKVRPFDFIIKPFKKEDLILTLKRVINLINITHEIFTYKKGHTLNKEIIKNIIYFESQGKEIKMVTIDKQILFYGSLKDIFEQLKK
ncbi:MAG: LytTR family DNA-binding domain-containing protein, partial [Eubacteriales bacterium]|nr:LytTR family DNA-binding domain-containing protein [Eubacteriales bacterium]